jgi:hypothetical protein
MMLITTNRLTCSVPAETAYEERPAGCEMTAPPDGNSFLCDRCHFDMVVFG